jgi:hypothetical protein
MDGPGGADVLVEAGVEAGQLFVVITESIFVPLAQIVVQAGESICELQGLECVATVCLSRPRC